MKSRYCYTTHKNSRNHQIFNNERNIINDKEESNLSRFWRECRERDIRKRRRISHQFRPNDNKFSATVNQLKLDAEILSNRFQRMKNKNIDKQNRRQSMCFNNYSEISKENINPNDGRLSNIYFPSSSGIKNVENKHVERSENSQIFFENKNYYSSLHNKYNLNSKKSNIYSVYNYFDSFKNDENRLKNRIQQKWQELKKDVDKTFVNYFNKRKSKKKELLINTDKETYCFKPSKKPNIIRNEQKDQEPQSLIQPQSEIIEDNEFGVNDNDELANNTSSIYSLSNLQKSNEYWDLSVRQLKDILFNMNVSIEECIEKKDLIQKIKRRDNNDSNIKKTEYERKSVLKCRNTRNKREDRKHRKMEDKSSDYLHRNKPSILYDTILDDTRESKQEIMSRVDLWIHRWSYRRSFRQLLNSVLGYKSNDKQYISRGKQGDQHYLLMMKLYKKAILLIHPDKHINSAFEVKYKSSEMFKILTNLCDKYRQKHQTRKKTYQSHKYNL